MEMNEAQSNTAIEGRNAEKQRLQKISNAVHWNPV